MDIEFAPEELRELARKCRREADEIQKGPISHFAIDAVHDLRREAERYDNEAAELEASFGSQKPHEEKSR